MEHIAQSDVSLDMIATRLRAGEVLVYPTETCYGLGCDATREDAVQRIFAIKKRQQEKSLLVIFPDQSMAMQYIAWNPTISQLAEKYWPGPLTVVAPLRHGISLPHGVVASDRTIAFRISSHPFVQALASALQAPLVSTSANIASMKSPYDIGAVVAMFEGQSEQPDIVIDAGSLPHHAPSTIVAIQESGACVVLRQGEVRIDSFV